MSPNSRSRGQYGQLQPSSRTANEQAPVLPSSCCSAGDLRRGSPITTHHCSTSSTDGGSQSGSYPGYVMTYRYLQGTARPYFQKSLNLTTNVTAVAISADHQLHDVSRAVCSSTVSGDCAFPVAAHRLPSSVTTAASLPVFNVKLRPCSFHYPSFDLLYTLLL